MLIECYNSEKTEFSKKWFKPIFGRRRLLWTTLIFRQTCSICSSEKRIDWKWSNLKKNDPEHEAKRTSEYYTNTHETDSNDQLDIAAKSLISFFLHIFHFSIYSLPMNWSDWVFLFVDSNIAKLRAWLKWKYVDINGGYMF